jgi:uncharacterized protein (DUF305 family)
VGPDLTGAATGGSTATGVDPPARFRVRLALLLVAIVALTGCGATTDPPAPAPGSAAATGFNDVDVMFLQMSIEYVRQGDQVAALAESRGGTAEVRQLATDLRTQWRTESQTMQRWLLGWQRPLATDPSEGAHAGHGDLHSLRPSDVAELRATGSADFDRVVLTLLVGHLHNCVEVSRMESAGGGYPPARSLADTMTADRQAEIQRMLRLLA